MKKFLGTSYIALLLLFILVPFAIAHDASASCESVTITKTPENHPAYITTGNFYGAFNSNLLYGPVGNGTYQVPGGTIYISWPAANLTKRLLVEECPSPSPSVTPSPSPSPSETPVPSATPRPTPTPRVTLPPTDTDG